MSAVFITGTDTGVGKTVISGLLARYLMDKGYSVITQKWIQTGSGNFPEDIECHLKLMKKKKEDIEKYLPCVAPYNFRFAGSPHLAARLEKRIISAEKIKKAFKFLLKEFDFVIVEGIGGSLVPYNRQRLVIDIVSELNLPALIVAGNKLGAINHTLLTIEAIRARNIKTMGILFNEINKNENDIIVEDNISIIKKLSGEQVLGTLPWRKNRELLYKAFLPAAEKIFARMVKKEK